MTNHWAEHELESLCDWTFVNSRDDSLDTRIATPTLEFWTEWRRDKESLKAAGVRVKPGPGGTWVATWNLSQGCKSPPATVAAASQPASAQVVNSRPAVVSTQVHLADDDRKWSQEQLNIFGQFRDGKTNLVVRARAGTGKTTTIKKAFEFAPEQRMLYVVFNKKNQREAVAKITDPRVDVKTLHSVGFACILQVWPKSVPDVNVEMDRVLALAKDIPDECARAVLKLVAFAKNTTLETTLDDMLDIADLRFIECPGFASEEHGGWTVLKLCELAMAVMELSKTRDPQNRISYDDMVWLPVVMKWVRPMFNLVVVDEAQDMNLPQLTMAQMACRKDGRICVVGDDRQAIYGFRGAVQDGLQMMKDVLQAVELSLTTTYRCPKKVVELAAALVPDYRAAPTAPDGTIENIVTGQLASVVRVGDAVLSRTNAALMPSCLSVLRKGIPARIEGRDIGKALVSILRSLKARSMPDLEKKIEKWGEKMAKRTEGRRNAEDRLAQIRDQVGTLLALSEGLASVSEVEARITSLFQDSDRCDRPAVIFSSVHKAKGLEWERVFLLRSTFMRTKKVGDKPSDEEQNIYYVALTRTKSHLVFVNEGAEPQETSKTGNT